MSHEQLTDTLQTVINTALSNLHTSTVAIVTAVNSTTIDCQPVINRVVDNESVKLPIFADVPPIFMQGGGSYTAHPIAVGDFCLLIFSERCFDRWWSGDNYQPPPELRMHDYSDAFAIIGVNNIDSSFVIPQVITQVGDTYYNGNHEHEGDTEQAGDVDITGDVTIDGNLTVTGTITVSSTVTCSGATIGGIDFASHVHSNPEGGTTGVAQ